MGSEMCIRDRLATEERKSIKPIGVIFMKLKSMLLLLITFTLFACDTGDPEPETNNGLLTFSILLSAGCEGIVRYVDVFFDDRSVGRVTPGGATQVDTLAGEHKIEGLSDNGFRWGPITRVIEFSGQTQTLTCS